MAGEIIIISKINIKILCSKEKVLLRVMWYVHKTVAHGVKRYCVM